jgi:hypothetical protein
MTADDRGSTTLSERRLLKQPLRTQDPQLWLVSAIHLWGLIVLALHLVAFDLPEEAAWSLWPYTLLPAWLGWLLALLAGALVIPGVSLGLTRVLDRLGLAWPARHARQRWFGLAALLAGLLFWLARLGHLRWGDGYMLSVLLSYPDLEFRVIYNWQAPLTVFLHQRLWQFIAGPLLGWPVEQVYAAVSIMCGVVFVYLLLTFAARLGRDPLEAAILAGLVLAAGSMQLFFGYVENYTIVSLALLLTLFLAWKTLQGQLQLFWPVVGLSLANAFHPSTVFLWPGMILLSGLCWKRNRLSFSRSLWQTVIPPLVVGGSVLILMESGSHGLSALLGVDRPGGGDGIWFVPLFETTTEWQRYTMFSAAHLLDWLNLHLLISPFGLPVLIFSLLYGYRFHLTIFDSSTERDYAYFLGLTAAMYLLFSWLWNPDYGGRKDWDLFAPSAFVYTLLAGYLLVRSLTDRQRLKETGLFMILISLLHTGAWIFTNTHNLPID